MLLNKNFSWLLKYNSLNIHTISALKKSKGDKMHWAELKRKKWGSDYCLENFDEYYKPVFGRSWSSIRLALLSQQKYCAFLNNYADIGQAESLMKSIGARNIRHGYNRRLIYLLKTMNSNMPGALLDDLPQEVECDQDSDEETGEELISDELDDDIDRFASQATHKSANFNEFVPATKIKGLDDWIDETDYFFQKNAGGSFNFITVKEKPAPLPEGWKIYAFNSGNISTFPSPKTANANVLGYYLMDMGSLLPVLALNPKPGDNILDMCAAPGGKTLAILQTLYDVNLTCNDAEMSRMKKLQNVFQEFIPFLENKSKLMVSDGKKLMEEQCGLYNKILVDVPCTTDRLSATRDDNNIFKQSRMAERIRLPQLQSELLSAALQAVKSGGTVVYSTCSLSPVQNDGVVHMALKQLWEESSANFVIHDLTDLFYPLRQTFFFQSGLKYGQLVIPNVLKNFGPTYICKISKV